MASIKKSILVQAPVEKLYDYLNDPAKLIEYWPGMLEVNDIQPLPNGGSIFKYVARMVGVRLEGTSEDTEIIPLKRMVSVTRGGVDAKIIWELEPGGEGTLVHLEEEYTVPVPVIGKLAEAVVVKLNEHEMDILLENVKAHMEA